MNTRQIKVPDEFKKNGLSVQGDQVAEIIYFTVDRYVDAMDLFRKDLHIVIQWEAAPKAGSTGGTEKGISVAYLKDITLYQSTGKMLFGWAINNAITKNAGAIKFSVRFYKFNEQQELDFSLSTLTAQANINPGLDYVWDGDNGQFVETIYDDSQMISNRIKDSIQPGDPGTTEPPEFLQGLVGTYELTLNEGDEEVVYKAIDLAKATDVAGDKTIQTDLVVQATGTGLISYNWSRKDLTTGNLVYLPNSENVGTDYVFSTDTTYSGSKIYYTKNFDKNGIPSYSVFTVAPGMKDQPIPSDHIYDPNLSEDEQDMTKVLYERVSHCKVVYPTANGKNVTGIYIVTAQNQVGKAKATLDDKILIPGPDKESFEIELPENQTENVFLADGPDGVGQATLSIIGKTARVTDTAKNIVGDTIVYTWEGEESREVINAATPIANQYIIPEVAAEDRGAYDKQITVEVHATRNGENSETKSQTFRITDKAHAPVVNISTPKGKTITMRSTDTLVLTATVENFDTIKHNGEGDGVTFNWYKVVLDDDDAFEPSNDDLIVDTDDCIKVTDGVCQFAFKPKHVSADMLNGETASGAYYCIATNTVNGSTATNDVTDYTFDDCISIVIVD